MYKEIKKCRVCQSRDLLHVLSLGEQALTGVFPATAETPVSVGPLDLVWCERCGLLQMKQSYSLDEMYGDNYGYRSGLNKSMVDHLTRKIRGLERLVNLQGGDVVVDIGSNDATALKAYSVPCRRIGIDPTGTKFKEFYPKNVALIPDFFSAERFERDFPGEKAKIVTSIAMFYDLEKPEEFVQGVKQILADDGIWHFEQSYMPSMLRSNAYDAVCHEHLEFYSFRVIVDLLEKCGMDPIDVQMNAVNGGSIAVTAAKRKSMRRSNVPVINWMLDQERNLNLDTPDPYRRFEKNVYSHRTHLVSLIESLVADGKVIHGYGASTKGNVLLQFCGLTSKQIPFIADVNPDKFGCVTPGTHIPIISEAESRSMEPDYYLVFPWHFKHNILERETEFIENGGKFIFPLPEIEIV